MARDQERKSVWGWAFYDWANSAFATTVMAVFFPIFFKTYWSAGSNVNVSTAQLGLGNSLASLLVALMAPVLGAVADRGSARKRFLIFFAYLGVLSTAALFLVGQGQWPYAILVYTLGLIGFSGGNVFYDSLLPEVAGEEILGRFEIVVTGDKVTRGKPHPEPYLTGLEMLGLKADQAVAVENAPAGIRSALGAGLTCLALSTTLSPDHLKEADQVFPSLTKMAQSLIPI